MLGEKLYVEVRSGKYRSEMVLSSLDGTNDFTAQLPPLYLWWERGFRNGINLKIMCLEGVISNVRVHKFRNQATSAPFTLSAADESSSTACVGGFEFDDSKSLEEGEEFYIESNEYPPFVGKIIPPGQRLQTQTTKKDWSNVDPNTVNLRDQNDWVTFHFIENHLT